MKDFIVDFASDFTSLNGLVYYLFAKFKLATHIVIELLLMGSMIVVHENLLKLMIIELCKRTRNGSLTISISIFAKLTSISTVHLVEKALSTSQATFMCIVCLFSYQFANVM